MRARRGGRRTRHLCVLIARNLIVEIGAKTIVDGVDLNVRAGEKVGLVGRNGAGKTSLLRVLGGAAQPKAAQGHRLSVAGPALGEDG
ncbi:MAG: ATP-binding cassette domain-containing protein [Acidimicrobiia bacterium]